MTVTDNLARPLDVSASRHTVPPSPKYCLRQSPSGHWYLIPYIYEFGFGAWCAQWQKDHVKDVQAVIDNQQVRWTHYLATTYPVPAYAKPVNIARLTFEQPQEVPYDA